MKLQNRQINALIVEAERRGRNLYCGPVGDLVTGAIIPEVRAVCSRRMQSLCHVKQPDGQWFLVLKTSKCDER